MWRKTGIHQPGSFLLHKRDKFIFNNSKNILEVIFRTGTVINSSLAQLTGMEVDHKACELANRIKVAVLKGCWIKEQAFREPWNHPLFLVCFDCLWVEMCMKGVWMQTCLNIESLHASTTLETSHKKLRACLPWLQPPDPTWASFHDRKQELREQLSAFTFATEYLSPSRLLPSVPSRPRYNYSCPRDDYMFTLEAGRLPVPSPQGAASQRGSSWKAPQKVANAHRSTY